ncbi:MAG: hydroxyacid dehydrogenase [Methanomassiliicoccales archaeon]
MTRILITDAVDERHVATLRETPGFDVDFRNGIMREELKDIIGNYDCIIVRSRTKLDAEMIKKATHAKLIVRAGVGIDNIDVDAAKKQNIEVANTPWANVISAAELTLTFALLLMRKVCDANASMHQGKWETLRFTGNELNGRMAGIIGLGRVGREVAKRLHAFDVEIAAYDPYISEHAASAAGAQLLPLDKLLSTCDIITLHASMLPGNVHLLGKKEFAMMKRSAVFINTARGEMVDSEALAEALEGGLIAGAACDVFEHEPAVDKRLASIPSLIMTPHIGAQTREAQDRVGKEVVQVVRSFFIEGKPQNLL